MGVSLTNLISNYNINLDQSGKYYLFETLNYQEKKTVNESIYFNKYKYLRKFINDSYLLKFLMMMVMINPFFKFISYYFSLDKYIIDDGFRSLSDKIMILLLLFINTLLLLISNSFLWKSFFCIIIMVSLLTVSYFRNFINLKFDQN